MKTYLIIPVLLLLLFAGCSDKSLVNNASEIEYVEVVLSANPMLTIAKNGFRGKETNSISFDNSYSHPIPSEFTAYFVANETKGEFVKGELVETLNVTTGDNRITIPMMEFTVYVSNFNKNGDWYTYNGSIGTAIDAHFPKSSDKLFLYGSKVIDYSDHNDLVGSVDLENPYSSVMIKDNQWVTGTPVAYSDGRAAYSLVGQPDENGHQWFNRYIRLDTSNTGVPLKHLDNEYKIDHKLDANVIYQFVFDGSVPVTDDGGLTVGTSGMEEGGATEIPYSS